MKGEEELDDSEFVDEEEDANPEASLRKLRERLKKAVAEKQEYLDGWQRARAEFANYKQQEEERIKNKELRIKVDTVEELLPILDSLELSVTHADEKSRKGLSGMYQQFLGVLKNLGIEKISAEKGQLFDHALHEALREEPVEDESLDHKIVNVQRSGYRLGDRIIRPAQVVIGRFEGS